MNIEEIKNFKCPFCNYKLKHYINIIACNNCYIYGINRFQIELFEYTKLDKIFIIFYINKKYYQYCKIYNSYENKENKIYLTEINERRSLELFELQDNSPIDIDTIFDVAKKLTEKYVNLKTFV